ncbi:MAG: hypothetical protein EZS28_030964 [Streblomastix strix]|uniref:Uncharacterized protein n=1 Tax=Streblomastix strix TaxID=222440 RepID=A0A5J4USZ7_9EUKA|nr:MAG: hypothetical protein EZS28_030964 [Streblomastix strix]
MKKFEKIISCYKNKHNRKIGTELETEELDEVITGYLELAKQEKGEFSLDPKVQLHMAINTMFGTWKTTRAETYMR